MPHITNPRYRKLGCTLRLLVAVALPGLACATENAQFPGFEPGNLVLSRSVYEGSAATVTVGQTLPPGCVSGNGCVTAVANGTYPVVFNNAPVDASFGVTSPIFLDQITTWGAAINTLAVDPNVLTTSFSSKSEMALNLSTDGTVFTFMGYLAPVNTLDVSNSNTPGVFDPTNPVSGSYYRSIAQVNASGAIQITENNAYSGNNGRAAILSNGLYYLVGNSNNGSGTPANVVAAAGAQIAVPSGVALTDPQPDQAPGSPEEIGNFSVLQINPLTGKPYASKADKAGKDNNFRGLTIFGNTMYISKGSGSNGIDTVFQVDTSGLLPTLATAPGAPITVLPGFNAVPEKTSTTTGNPFGLFFANANTLYVADEGDGTAADEATSTLAGLQKWSLVDGVWQLDYVLQNGLNLGVPYSIANYPSNLNPSTDGLRNVTGRVNGDGTVTMWAVTSTVSANGDQGADPNLLVTITDTLAFTTAAEASGEQFGLIRAANYGEVLRGVSFTPGSNLLIAPTVSFTGAPASAPFKSTFTVSATTNASTTASIVASGACTISGNSVTMTSGTGTCSLVANWAPDSTYRSATSIQTTIATKLTPVVSWSAPAAITFGGALGNGQLDATATIPGTFVYNPPAGTVLPVGNNEPLSVTFTPNDATDYTTATGSTTITVNPAPASPANLVVTKVLTRTGGNVVVTLTIANTGGTGAANVVLSSVKVGADTATPLPQTIGTIAAGATTQATVSVPGSVGASGAASSLTLNGTYTGGTFSSSARITLP
jgi:hypothetical protein